MATNAANSKTAPRQVTIRLPNPQALLSTVLGVLLLLLGLIYLRQGWDAWRADSLRSELAGQAEALAGIISERISSHQASLDRVVTERDFLETFASEGMGTHAGSKQRLMALLPEALSAEVLDAPVLESVGADLADFGYARVEMLLQSERSQKGADAQIHRAPDGDDLRVVLVSPILVAGTVAGHAMVELPYGPLRTALNDWRGSSGTLDLVQGTEIQDALVIDKLGSERSAFDGSIVTVPRTRLAIAYSVPPPFALIAPSSAIPASVLGVIGLLIGVTLVALRAQLKKVLNRAREATPDEPTLADSLGQQVPSLAGRPART